MQTGSHDISGLSHKPSLPLGSLLFRRLDGLLIVGELVCGALVWFLEAGTNLPIATYQGWVMFVAVTFFILTFIQFVIYLSHVPERNIDAWKMADILYNSVAFGMYLSASVLLANLLATYSLSGNSFYGLNVAAVIFAFLTTLFYGMSVVFGIRRGKFE
ncbi:protein MAL2-like [Petromyzon marinus]|uniref:Protein MAL2-like n=1 Tax=Petromyzon marinus TaxID=7757 RepID=A0AAJ7X1Q3_PETMA|nr:protein MAL2-like [Petromyzon marinus]